MRILRFRNLRVSDADKAASLSSLLAAEEAVRMAKRIKSESVDVGESLRQLRTDNHFGRSLTHVFRPETRGQG